jgi:SAM-dependent methyltransferase
MLAARSHDGIPFHLKFSTLADELGSHPREFEALDLAKRIGWQSALERVFDAEVAAYSINPERSNFLNVLPLAPHMRVLEIGIGMGQHTVQLAKRVAHVDAIEVILANAMFTQERCKQIGAQNVTVHCGGDDCRLPFPEQTYDAVILNLVLEWCGASNPTEPQEAGQRRLLSEIHRVLKPGGFAQISTKNRYALRHLVGGRDGHCQDMPFGSALPRFLLRRLVKNPGGLLHSYRGLCRMISDAGLDPRRSYWAAPEMRRPKQFMPIEAIASARRSMPRQGETRLTNLIMRVVPNRLVKHVAPGLFFVAFR